MGVAISTGKFVDDGTMTGIGTIAATMPITNLQISQLAEPARWTSLTGMAAQVDLGAAKSISLVALFGHNGTAAATWQIRGATSEANLTAAPGYDTGSISMWPVTGRPSELTKLNSLHLPASAQSFRWWRIDLTDAANPDGFFDAGRLHVDDAWLPTFAVRLGGVPSFRDPSIRERSFGGQSWVHAVTSYRVASFSVPGMDDDEMFTRAYELQSNVGLKKDAFFIRDTLATTHMHRQTVYGELQALQPIVNVAHGIYESPFELQEIIP